jgi:hypothetical protein
VPSGLKAYRFWKHTDKERRLLFSSAQENPMEILRRWD